MFRLRVLGLRVQLSLLFSLFALAALLLLGVASSRLVASRATAIVGNELAEVAAQVADELERSFDERLQDLILLSQDITTGTAAEPEAVRARLEALKGHHSAFAWIGLVDKDGTVQVATAHLLEGAAMGSRPWFGRGLQEPFVVDTARSPLLEHLLLGDGPAPPQRLTTLAVPVKPQGGAPSGILAAFLNWRWTESYAQLHFGNGSHRQETEIVIVARNGTMISGVDDAAGEGLPPSVLEATERSPAGFLQGPCGAGQTCLYGYTRLPEPKLGGRALDWLVVVRQPLAVALDLVDDLRRLILLGGIAIAVALCLLGWLAAGRIAQPLRQLSRSAQRIALGETEATVPMVSGYKEVQTLALVLHRMLAGIKQKQAELERANATLEERVAQRTHDLLQANAALTDEIARRRRIEAEREGLIRRLRDMAETDFLTGLMNRRSFYAAAARELLAARRYRRNVALLLLDIDHFKRINDTHGHQSGDLVLQRLAEVCRRTLRDSDLLARFGGEEFVALLQETDRAGAVLAAERLRHAVEAEVFPLPHGATARVTVSLGVAGAADETPDIDSLVGRADEALYRAKAQGRNRVAVA